MQAGLFRKEPISEENLDLYTSGMNQPLWFYNARPRAYRKLEMDITVDDVIVGGGITGITTAYYLSRAGRKIALVDDGYIGSGESGRTTAHLTYALDTRFYNIRKRGDDVARAAMESHRAAIDAIEENVKSEGIDCDFKRVNGYLYPSKPDQSDELNKELNALRELGNTEVESVNRTGAVPYDPGLSLQFSNQGQFHPLKYLLGMADAIERNGGQIYTGTHVSEFSDNSVRTLDGKTISAKSIIVATYSPVHTTTKMHTKQAPYRTFVLAFEIPRNYVSTSLLWSTGIDLSGLNNSYTYIRTQPLDESTDALVVGGLDHKTGQTDDGGQRLQGIEQWVNRNYPEATDVIYSWSGQIMNPADDLGFIGRDSDNYYLATGYSGNGMTHGTVAGMLLSDLILGKANDSWVKAYDPNRKISAATSISNIQENLNTFGALLGSVIGGSTTKEKDVTGSVEKKGLKDYTAKYTDEDNHTHNLSATCRHMGCTVGWNSTEKTFDCPCHGSRYTALGKVVNGPANGNLNEK